jgi:uncharacterized membrane protein
MIGFACVSLCVWVIVLLCAVVRCGAPILRVRVWEEKDAVTVMMISYFYVRVEVDFLIFNRASSYLILE